MNYIPAGPILLSILCKSSNLTGPDEEVTSLIASAPKFVTVKFPALKSLDKEKIRILNKWLKSGKRIELKFLIFFQSKPTKVYDRGTDW